MIDTTTPAGAMVKDAMERLEVAIVLPDGEQIFQRELMEAEGADALDPRRAIMLAYAALSIASAGQSMFGGWYSEKAMMLLRRVADVMGAMEEKSGASVN
jgi:hypothetical protein